MSDGANEFLNRNLGQCCKWVRAYYHRGRRYDDMTSNMAECFDNVLKDVHLLLVIAIAVYAFHKLSEYF